MQSKKLISVIMSAGFESPEHLTQAIQSILDQSYSQFEYIIINDNPNNRQVDNVLNTFAKKDKRIVYLKNKKNKGLAYSLNRAVEHANGSYIARMDADDIASPDRFAEQVKFLNEHSQCNFVFSWVNFIDHNGKQLGSFKPNKNKVKNLPKYLLKEDKLLIHPTAMIRKQALQKTKYDPTLQRAQDFDLWIRNMHSDQFAIVEKVLLEYRIPATGPLERRIDKVKNYSKWGLVVLAKNMNRNWTNMYYIQRFLKTIFFYIASRIPKKIIALLVK